MRFAVRRNRGGRQFRAWSARAGAALAGAWPAAAEAASNGILSGLAVDARKLLILGILLGLITFAVVTAIAFLRAARNARAAGARAIANAETFEKQLDVVHSILTSEPQLLIYWDPSGTPHLVARTLGDSLGPPRDLDVMLRFDTWLERDSARDLEDHLKTLREHGQAFNLMLRTASGGNVEAAGRPAGGGAVLKMLEPAGNRAEVAELHDTQRRLRLQLDTTRSLLDALPMPIWLRGGDGRLNWTNRAYALAVEAATPEEACQQQIELMPSRQRAAAVRWLAEGETFHRRIQTLTGGEQRAFDVIAVPLGQTSGGAAIEVTKPEPAGGDADGHIEARTKTLDRIATAVAMFSADQRLSYFNQAYQDLFELDAAWLASGPRHGEMLDRLREQSLLPEQRDYREWKEEQLGAYERAEPREEWWHLPDGRSIHVLSERAADGGLTYLFENLTERLDLESRYNALIRVRQETLDHLREGVAVFAADGRLKLFNWAFAEIWKLSAKTLSQEPHIDDVIAQCRVLLDDAEAWQEVKTAVTSIGEQREAIEGHLERPDGSIVAYAGLPLPDGATLLTYVDITDSNRVEQALRERNEALEAADHIKTAFISHVSYELRTPLNSIIGFSELLASPEIGALNDKQREYLADIRSSTDTLQAIINDILDLATIDAGTLDLDLSPVSVNDVVEAAILGVRERIQRAQLSLDVFIDDDVGAFVADERRVTQVLYNLLSNAVGFSDEGGLVRLNCERDGDMIAITVVDQGRGIPEDYQSAAFDRFESRPHGSGHRGAGLGLSIVKSLVELHGGDITLDSAPGEGTTVTVRFPAEQAAAFDDRTGGTSTAAA